MHFPNLFLYSFVASGVVSALPGALPEQDDFDLEPRSQFPFDRMIAIGDNLSDNGNGSYAHGVQSPKQPLNTIYGYRTWTNGPVAVSYLSTLLGIPLTADYAFGEADGGTKLGATINNSYTPSAYAQDGFQQVQNYTHSKGFTSAIAAKTLHFVWIGSNDISLKHINVNSASNTLFASQMAFQMNELVGRLVTAGAKHVFVASMYPKQLTPGRKYMVSTDLQITNLGLAIDLANKAIKTILQENYGSQVIYFDAFTYMVNLYNNAAKYGINYVLPDYCDGYSQADWNLCVKQKQGSQFYWMQQVDPTTAVHSLIAKGMARTINAAFST